MHRTCGRCEAYKFRAGIDIQMGPLCRSKLSFVTAPRSSVNNLVVDNLLLWLLEPILLWGSDTTLGLSLKLNGRVLVCL